MKMKERVREMLAEERFREILKIVNEKKNSDCDRVDRTSGYFRVYDQKRPDTAS